MKNKSVMHRSLSKFLARYFVKLQIAFHELPALFGFCVFLTIYNQLVTGVMLSFSLVPESMYIPLSREEEDAETLYTDDFFFLHERGVDLLVIFLFLHMFRKLYINALGPEQELAWKGGVLLFLLAQFVIFTGLTLCCTHLSDVTLTIAINAFNSFCLFIGKVAWVVAPDYTLNIDTVVRLAYLHYITAFMLGFFGVYHGVDMHYNWKTEEAFDGVFQELDWNDEAVINEVGQLLNLLVIFGLLCVILYPDPDALNYELFMWGDVGMQVDVRYFGVAPHWYFRPYMGWLVACPFHYLGLIGLILFFIGFYFQPNIMRPNEWQDYSAPRAMLLYVYFWVADLSKKVLDLVGVSPEKEWFYEITFTFFLISIWYAFSYLPYGRFFNRLGGNDSSLLIYIYLYLYLCCPALRTPRLFNLSKNTNI